MDSIAQLVTTFYLPTAAAPTHQSVLLIFLISTICALPQGVLQMVKLVKTDKDQTQACSRVDVGREAPAQV